MSDNNVSKFETKDRIKFHLINSGALAGELYLVDLGGHKIVARVGSEGSWPVARLLTDAEIDALPAPDENTEALQFDADAWTVTRSEEGNVESK